MASTGLPGLDSRNEGLPYAKDDAASTGSRGIDSRNEGLHYANNDVASIV